MTKLIINVETGETTERELNSEEVAQEVIDQAAEAERSAAEAAKAEQKAELLERLGITAEEAQLLLGGN
jgi:hypothetical protein